MDLSQTKSRGVGVDISQERTTFAIVDVRGNIIAQDSFSTLDFPDLNKFITELCDRIMRLVKSNGGYESIHSIGISSPSGNVMTNSIENSPNLPWKGIIPLAAMIRDRMALAVALANDVHTSALGEWAYGAAHGMRDFAVVHLGNGVGGCLFSNGHEHLGFHGFGGELGHSCVVDGGRLCNCGLHGCLEAYTSTRGIIQTAHEVLAESSEPSLMRDMKELNPITITDACNQGDALAIEVYRRTGRILGLSLANYATLVDPEAIILIGGITLAGEWLLKPTIESFDEHVFGNIRGKVKLLLSKLTNEERDVLGASALAWEVKEYSLFK